MGEGGPWRQRQSRGAAPGDPAGGGEHDAAAASAFMSGRGQPLGTAGTARRRWRPRPAPPSRGLRQGAPSQGLGDAGLGRGSCSPRPRSLGSRRPRRSGGCGGTPPHTPTLLAAPSRDRPYRPRVVVRAGRVNRAPRHLRRAWEGSGSLDAGTTSENTGPGAARSHLPGRRRPSTLRAVKDPLEHNKGSETTA